MAIVKLIDPVLMKWIHAIPQWILYTLSGAIVMLMIWDNIVSHIAFNLVKKEIDGVEADNSEEVSTKVRQLLREDPVLLRRIGEAYPNLEVKSKELAKKLKAQAEAVQESEEAGSGGCCSRGKIGGRSGSRRTETGSRGAKTASAGGR